MSEEMFADLMESAIEMVEMENAMSTEKFKVTDNREQDYWEEDWGF